MGTPWRIVNRQLVLSFVMLDPSYIWMSWNQSIF